jgi:hypothetical protein
MKKKNFKIDVDEHFEYSFSAGFWCIVVVLCTPQIRRFIQNIPFEKEGQCSWCENWN